MLNQLIRIQARYIGLLINGCLIDGLIGLVNAVFRLSTGQFGSSSLITLTGDLILPVQSDRTGSENCLQPLRYWHVPGDPLRLQQG